MDNPVKPLILLGPEAPCVTASRQASPAAASRERHSTFWLEYCIRSLTIATVLKIKRIYAAPAPSDGYRVLVDRLWPRGLAKGKARVDLWMKEIAPSHALRKWFGHDPTRWTAFRARYRRELKDKSQLIGQLKHLRKEHGAVTLLYSAHDEQHNQAVALREFLLKRPPAKRVKR